MTNEDLEASARAAAVETREAIARAERAEAEVLRLRDLLEMALDANRHLGLPTDAVMMPSQVKVVAKIIRNQESADEVIACLRLGRCHGADKVMECETCSRCERAVGLVQALAGLGAP